MKREIIAAAAAVLAVGMLAGCGGGSSSTTAAKVAGKVADGYLEKATVFMDKNNNYRLDDGEPNMQTDANGVYSLTVDPADLGKYPIVALAVKDVTIDQDTGLPVAHSYLLSLPKDSVSGTVSSNFISPLTTQVREMMETGNYTMTEAMEQLRLKLHVAQDSDVMGDYMAGQNQALHATAQKMATLMGGQMGQVYQSGSDTVVDVNRYRGMMGAMFSNMSSVRAAATDADMTQLMTQMSSNLNNITIGQPFHNMSSYFGGMTGSGGMMGR
ncbi:hypothetical protein KOM00_10005 [Geomonas sp. Red69]|uniref:Lipoprotein n=1 Tax=Geomonas diazotrophica TaxID=2843197 RepID=A0ABX8JPP8_9BACT|nr:MULTISPECIES: hypothetical protein [Geomonas]MBU5637066.1 hypothetical protein [Geomonas diazotrophica]QWV99367.1 hypothetical protein KP005_08855 [Geomonas nitrogeniifigens]QXE88542.1 hypothetical protein KP003_09145 [Geomonas nitrogeniifigens]